MREKQIGFIALIAKAVFAPDKEIGSFVINVIALLALTLVGCGKGVEMAPVRGVVNVDGQPVVGAGVTFIPVDGGRPAWATTDEAGRFELSSKDPGDGARVGEYVVTVAEAPFPVSSEPELEDPGLASVFGGRQQNRKNTKKTMIDLKYASRSTSDLRFTVQADEENVAELSLTTK